MTRFARGRVKNSARRLDALANTGVRCLSLDHSLDLAEAKHSLGPDIAVQGNLDPALLDAAPEVGDAALSSRSRTRT